jgi:hypothetical protein
MPLLFRGMPPPRAILFLLSKLSVLSVLERQGSNPLNKAKIRAGPGTARFDLDLIVDNPERITAPPISRSYSENRSERLYILKGPRPCWHYLCGFKGL